MKKEFSNRYQSMIKDPEVREESLRLLNLLLNSDNESERRNGVAWISMLLTMGNKLNDWSITSPSDNSANNSKSNLQKSVEKEFFDLAKSQNHRVRRGYLKVVEKLILFQKGSFSGKLSDDTQKKMVKSLVKLMSDYLSHIIETEKHLSNLILIVSIILHTAGFFSGTKASIFPVNIIFLN